MMTPTRQLLLLALLLLGLSSCKHNATTTPQDAFSIDISPKKKEYPLGDPLQISIRHPRFEGSVQQTSYQIHQQPVTTLGDKIVLENLLLGKQYLSVSVQTNDGKQYTVKKPLLILAQHTPKLLSYRILNEYPHDKEAYTQGLEFIGDTLVESTGQYKQSSIRKWNPFTGEICQNVPLQPIYFGEGATVFRGKILQLTWRENIGFVYDQQLKVVKTFAYGKSKEGWGLCHNGTDKLYKSDGTEKIWLLHPETFAEIDSLQRYWEAFPSLRADLFAPEKDKPYSLLRMEEVRQTIENNADVQSFKQQFANAFDGFADAMHQRLIDNTMTVHELTALDEIATDIFKRVENIALVDKYAAYQALADNWQTIVNDIETLQQDGLNATREVETAYKMVKKGDEEIEVPDGVKGRIIPFKYVQQAKFQAELTAIANMQQRIEVIASELDDLHDSFTEEETESYCDAEKDNAFDKAAIKANAKPKADVEPETKAKLEKIVALWNEQTKTNKEIRTAKQQLIDKTVKAIENLSDAEVATFLHEKWIEPVCNGIDDTLRSVLATLETSVVALNKKYAVSYKQINDEFASTNKELAGLIDQLTGDERAIEGLKELIKD